jgi:quinol monooxygenase YgiN
MSVLITSKFHGDTAVFRSALVDHADRLAAFAEQSRAAGAIHHRFGVGDGFVLVVDEWTSVEQFQQFFGNPDLQAFIAAMGADPGPPEITVTEAVSSADQF